MNREQTLDAARQAVLKDRAATHGAPESSFALIADLWSALLGQDISPAQVCLMLAVLKVARGWDNPGHADNWVDLAGYAACGAEVAGLDEVPGCDVPPEVVARSGVTVVPYTWDDLHARSEPDRDHSTYPLVEDPAEPPAVRRFKRFNDRDQPAEWLGATEGGDQAAETAPAPEAVPTPAAQDRQGPPPSDPPPSDPPRHGKPGPDRRKVDALWYGGFTDAEKAEIVARAVAGETSGQIAKVLERPAKNVSVLMATALKTHIAAAKAAAGQDIDTGAGAPPPAPAPSSPGADVSNAGEQAPGETEPTVLYPTDAARVIAKRLRQSELVTASLPEWLTLIETARGVHGWTLEQDRQLLDLIGQKWTPGDIAALTERSLDELKARKVQLTCAGKWPLATVAAALGVEA